MACWKLHWTRFRACRFPDALTDFFFFLLDYGKYFILENLSMRKQNTRVTGKQKARKAVSVTSASGARVSYHDHSTSDFVLQMRQIPFFRTSVHIFYQNQFPIQSKPRNTWPRHRHKYLYIRRFLECFEIFRKFDDICKCVGFFLKFNDLVVLRGFQSLFCVNFPVQ